MRRYGAAALAAALIVSTTALSAFAVDLDVRRHHLDNGMRVLTLEDHTLPVASFFVFYKVGSRNEDAGLTGISHLFEHMMFNGAKRYGPKEFDRVLESNGGYSNAFTSTDMTVYYEDFPSEVIELIMDLESDRMENLAFEPGILESERDVVKEERRLVVDNYLPGRMEEALFAAAFTAHPYHWPVIGWMSDIENITREHCMEYFRTYYAPDNAIVVIVGDIDTGDTMDLMRRYFGSIEPGRAPSRPMSAEPDQEGEVRVRIVRPARSEQFMAGFHAPDVLSTDLFALDVAQTILSDGESSRLYRRLIYEEQAALDVRADFTWKMDPALYYFHVEMRPGVKAARGEEILYEELEALKTGAVTDKELQKAKNILEANLLRALKTNNGRAEMLGYMETVFGDYNMLFTLVERYKAVTAGDVEHVMQKYFDERNRTVVALVPEGTED